MTNSTVSSHDSRHCRNFTVNILFLYSLICCFAYQAFPTCSL